MTTGKGSTRRRALINRKQVAVNWARTFGGDKKPPKKFDAGAVTPAKPSR